MAIHVQRFVTGVWKENCYCVSKGNGECFLVDPGADGQTIRTHIEAAGLSLRAILHTHGHFDHIGATVELKKIFNAPTYLHMADKKQLRYAASYQKLLGDQGESPLPEVDYDLSTLEQFEIAGFSLRVIQAPGHTEGSVCFLLSGYLFTGDTLMHGSIGRTDLLGGSRSKLQNSLRGISLLPPDTIICPGHGEMSTLADELAGNMDLKEALDGLAH